MSDEMTPDPEEKYPPRPGGMVDSTRKQRAADQAQADAIVPLNEVPGGYEAVRVDVQAADTYGAQTYAIGTGLNPQLRILGEDSHRRRAVIMTLDEPVVIAISQSAADDPRNASNAAGQSAGGFVLPVNVPLVLKGSGEVWAVATSSTNTRVSVWAEKYGA